MDILGLIAAGLAITLVSSACQAAAFQVVYFRLVRPGSATRSPLAW